MRREIRYRVDAPAQFSWQSRQGKRIQGEGFTRDISVLGAFILAPTCPPVDVPVHVEVLLPTLHGLRPVFRVSGPARVLRVEQAREERGESGFAVVSQDSSRWSMTASREESASSVAENAGVCGRNGDE
jgi:hypothetical protein